MYYSYLSEQGAVSEFTLQTSASILARAQNVLTTLAEEGNECTVGHFLHTSTFDEYHGAIQQLCAFYTYLVFGQPSVQQQLTAEQLHDEEYAVLRLLGCIHPDRTRFSDDRQDRFFSDFLKTIGFPVQHAYSIRKLRELVTMEWVALQQSFATTHLGLLQNA